MIRRHQRRSTQPTQRRVGVTPQAKWPICDLGRGPTAPSAAGATVKLRLPHLPAAARPTPTPQPHPGKGSVGGGCCTCATSYTSLVRTPFRVCVSCHVDIFVIRTPVFAFWGRALKFEGHPSRLLARDTEILKQLIMTTTRRLQCLLFALKVDLDPEDPLTETKEESWQ